MKRYRKDKSDMWEDPKGEWVKWHDVKFWLNAIDTTLHRVNPLTTPTQICVRISRLLEEARGEG